MSTNRGIGLVDPVIRPGRNPSASRMEKCDRMIRGISGVGFTRVSYRLGKIKIDAGAGLDLSKFCFGLSISGATVTIKAGDWPIGEPVPLELADTPVTISQDLQYVGLEVDTIAKTIIVIGPSITKSIFYPDAQKFRCWLHQFNFSGGTATLKRTRLGSLFMPSTFGATP